MTIAERNSKLKHFITCLKCEVSGKCCDDNCSTQYDAGNMGEIIENLEAISKALEQEPITKNDLGVDMIDQLITKIAYTMNVSEAYVATAIDTLINTSQPYKPLQGLCKSAKKNDLEVDLISRADARKAIIDHQYSDSFCEEHSIDHSINTSMALIALSELPSAIPQEPFKPMVEIDLYSVIKQKYIEREVLDKIRAEIKHFMYDVNPSSSESDYACNYILQIIDKYKAETEET